MFRFLNQMTVQLFCHIRIKEYFTNRLYKDSELFFSLIRT